LGWICLDETTFLVALIDPVGAGVTSINSDTSYSSSNSWAKSSTTVLGTSVISPTVIDIRTTAANRGRRYDMSSGDIVVAYEESQTLDYPTIDWSVRNEGYTLTLHIRTIQDERGVSDENFARDRLENLYKVVRHRLEQNRKGATIVIGSQSKTIDQIHTGSRTESNDRNKRLFGYKLTVELKKFAVTLP